MQDTNKLHNLILEGRSKLTLSGITDVDSFDDKTVVLFTQMGELTVCGKNLRVNEINVESGDMSVEGDIWSLSYGDKDRRSSVSFLGKLFR